MSLQAIGNSPLDPNTSINEGTVPSKTSLRRHKKRYYHEQEGRLCNVLPGFEKDTGKLTYFMCGVFDNSANIFAISAKERRQEPDTRYTEAPNPGKRMLGHLACISRRRGSWGNHEACSQSRRHLLIDVEHTRKFVAKIRIAGNSPLRINAGFFIKNPNCHAASFKVFVICKRSAGGTA